MTQHANLSSERWSDFSLDQQILMIGNEMNRGMGLMEPEDLQELRLSYQRVLRLTDLTIEVQQRPALRRELLLWRGFIADLSLRDEPDPAEHKAAFRSLLQLTPVAAQQIAFVLED